MGTGNVIEMRNRSVNPSLPSGIFVVMIAMAARWKLSRTVISSAPT
jgi:hypothetical protein